jgi:hypothetical protein
MQTFTFTSLRTATAAMSKHHSYHDVKSMFNGGSHDSYDRHEQTPFIPLSECQYTMEDAMKQTNTIYNI